MHTGMRTHLYFRLCEDLNSNITHPHFAGENCIPILSVYRDTYVSGVEENTERKQAVPVCFFYGIICVLYFLFFFDSSAHWCHWYQYQ